MATGEDPHSISSDTVLLRRNTNNHQVRKNDLSVGIVPDFFKIDDIARIGVNSQISCLAYDPVQSLLAVGTKKSQFGPGQIYVFGRDRIQATLQLRTGGASVHTLQFCAEKLIALDTKHEVSVFSLELKRLITSYSPPGGVTTLCTDATLDYALLGMQTGEILAYDLDRQSAAPFKIPPLMQGGDPRAHLSPIVSLQFHPRDVGTLLVGYQQGAAVYSFKANKALRFFHYEIPRGAPGGDGNPAATHIARRPKLTQAVWHPTGTFVLTGYEDSSLVFWDALKDGRMLMARTLADTNITTPGARSSNAGGGLALKEPLFKIAWCANGKDPEDTAILIAGGAPANAPQKGLCLFEMGRTPVYQTSRWEDFTHYFESPKRQRILPTPPGAEVTGFCPIPRTSPHFNGAHDPIAVIALLASGELLTLTFPSGMPISPTNQLHVSLTYVHPFVKRMGVSQISREKWLGLQERRQQGPAMLKGGAETSRPMRRFERRNIVHTTHADGTVRLWDLGFGDEIENGKVLQVDVATAVGRLDVAPDIRQISLAGESAELAVGMGSGELVVFRWAMNRNAGREPPRGVPNQPKGLTNILDRAEPSLSQGLLPFTLLDQQDGAVTAVHMSEIGFVAAGFEGGSIAVIDLRGPAIIYNASIASLNDGSSKSSIRRRTSTSAAAGSKVEFATQMEFGIMTLNGELYSSILLHVGTNSGRLATFKILPDPSGRYTVQYAGSTQFNSRIIYLGPINAETGSSVRASQNAMAALRNGLKVNGILVAVTPTEIHIFKPASAKGAHKSFDNCFCDSASVVRYQDQGYALVGLFGDGTARAYSIPSMKELASAQASEILDVRRFSDAAITPTGHILGFTGPSEMALIQVWGTGEPLLQSPDKLFNPEAIIPPRPTISNIEWISGTQYVTPADMDVLIGGPNRPPSKRMIAQAQADEQMRRQQAGRPGAASSRAPPQDEGYWAYMQRQIQERTENMGLVGDSMDNLEENSRGWFDDVNKFVATQKRNAVTGGESISMLYTMRCTD